jgi:transcriptional regulator with XRE-family HTH domain
MERVPNNRKKEFERVKAAMQRFQVTCGGFFREKRLLQNRTEEEVAGFLRVSAQTIRDYESGNEAIPLHQVDALSRYLRIPPEEILQLHLNLEKAIMPDLVSERNLTESRDIGKIVQQARKTLFLSGETLAKILSHSGYPISEQELSWIESGEVNASSSFWHAFCTLLHLDLDAVRGYSRWKHLTEFNAAFRKNEVRFPIGSELLNALENHQHATEAHNFKLAYLLKFSLAFKRRWFS